MFSSYKNRHNSLLPQARFLISLLDKLEEKGFPCPRVEGWLVPFRVIFTNAVVELDSSIKVILYYGKNYHTEYFSYENVDGVFNLLHYHLEYVQWEKLIGYEELNKIYTFCMNHNILIKVEGFKLYIYVLADLTPLRFVYDKVERVFETGEGLKYKAGELLHVLTDRHKKEFVLK